MNLLVSFAIGLALGAAETALVARLGGAPDLLAAALALLLAAAPSRRTGPRCIGLLLGVAPFSLAPLSSLCAGAAVAAFALSAARSLLFAESAPARAFFGLLAWGALAATALVFEALGRGGSSAGALPAAMTALLTALAVPILAPLGSGSRRVARRIRAALGVLQPSTRGGPSG